MSRLIALVVAVGCAPTLMAQAAYYSVSPMSMPYSGGVAAMAAPYMPMAAPYMSAYGPMAGYGAQSIAYRADSMMAFGSAFVPNYSYPYYAPGYGYTPMAYGLGYTVGGNRVYVTAMEATTTLPSSFVPPPVGNAYWSDYRPAYGAPPIDESRTLTNMTRITAYVPADAEVIINGQAKTEIGPVRTFEMPANSLETYTVIVRQKVNGKAVDQTSTLTLRAGDHSSIRVLQ